MKPSRSKWRQEWLRHRRAELCFACGVFLLAGLALAATAYLVAHFCP